MCGCGWKEGKRYDSVATLSMKFLPDNISVVYEARVGGKWCVVAGEKEGEAKYDNIVDLISDPFIYSVKIGNEEFVIINEQRASIMRKSKTLL